VIRVINNWTWKRLLIVLTFIAIWLVGWFFVAYQRESIPQAGETRGTFVVFFVVMVVVGVLIPATIATLFFVELDRRRNRLDMRRAPSPVPRSDEPPSQHFPH
jgi:hypothetical protein